MKVLWNVNQLTFATIGGFIGWFWGGCDGLIYALIHNWCDVCNCK